MKIPLFALSALCLPFALVGCADYYATGPVAVPAYYSPAYPVATWGGAGFYGGSCYRGANWNNNNYYRNGSGNVDGWRGGSASWNHGSGSASGYRGGSASWGGGSGSWSGARGGSGSFHR
jgi:hypothetical protein